MAEHTRSCENCGNTRCANSFVAFWWDECVKSGFEKHWMPKQEEKQAIDFDKICKRIQTLNRGIENEN